MKRLGVSMGVVAVGLSLLAWASGPAAEGRHEGVVSRSPSGVERRPVTERRRRKKKPQWTCAVRHTGTGYRYKCTQRGEEKACRCAIARCKKFNIGTETQCASHCKCHKG